MPFQKGHPPYPRKSRLTQVGGETRVTEDEAKRLAGASDFAHLDTVTNGAAPPDIDWEKANRPPRRWTAADIEEWFAARLMQRWGGNPVMWANKLANLSSSNDYLFITNEDAVLLAARFSHPMSGRALIAELFAFAREDGDARCEAAVAGLRRQMRQWGKSARAEGFAVAAPLC